MCGSSHFEQALALDDVAYTKDRRGDVRDTPPGESPDGLLTQFNMDVNGILYNE